MTTVLVLDRRTRECAGRCRALCRCGFDVFAALSEDEALEIVKAETPAVAVVDLSALESRDLSFLGRLKELDAHLGIVALAQRESVRLAVKAIRLGARDYISAPVRDEDLAAAVTRAAEERALRDEVQRLRDRLDGLLAFPSLIGKSPAFLAALRLTRRAADSQATVLLLGESGTGKELFAHAIHHNSSRSRGPFVIVDCVSLPETLMESELFGYERGAFTGADRRKPGRFELAHKGTIFLDEVGNLPVPLQAKLLRVIESRSFTRLGGNRTVKADVRILAATNADLRREVKAGRFREDLFYRLNVVTIRLPPLRERHEDITLLAGEFLRDAGRRHGRGAPELEAEALDVLRAHVWPGNVRELKNTIEHLVVVNRGTISAESVRAVLFGPEPARPPGLLRLKRAMQKAADDQAVVCIKTALEKCSGNKTAAARELAVSVKTLYNLMHRLGMM